MEKRFDPVTEKGVQKRKDFESADETERQSQTEKDWREALELNKETFYQKIEKAEDEREKEPLQLAINIAEEAKNRGGLALVVGGFARDEAFRRFGRNLEPKDIDIEVYGLKFEELKEILEKFGKPNIVGESFGVIKIKDLDVSIPRRDSKNGRGHKGFTIEGDPSMTIQEAARRRDFTINALALDPLTGELVDKFNGLKDMANGILRATDSTTFVEDPLRVLRAMQFAGRFDLSIDPETAELCRSLDLNELSAERIGEEWRKLLLKSERPSVGLEVGRQLNIFEKLHPELQALIGVPQDPEWHPEGDVWVHNCMVVDCAAEIVRREKLEEDEAVVIMLAALCHDFGKPATTAVVDGRIRSFEHEKGGVGPTISFLKKLKVSQEEINKITKLVQEHLFPTFRNTGDAAIRRLSLRLSPASIEELVWVAEADQKGRALPWKDFDAGRKLLERAKELEISRQRPTPLILGRDLINLGVEPGPKMGEILKKLYEAQLDGKFNTKEEGLVTLN